MGIRKSKHSLHIAELRLQNAEKAFKRLKERLLDAKLNFRRAQELCGELPKEEASGEQDWRPFGSDHWGNTEGPCTIGY